jgi:HK97 gp10 family phage protein
MADSETKIVGLEELGRRLMALPEAIARGPAEDAMLAGAKVIQKAAQQKAPVKTGKLRKAIRVRKSSNLDARRAAGETLEADASVYIAKGEGHIARFNEFGTGPHTIVAHGGGAIAIGGEVVGKSVDHPGQPARPFMRPAFDTSKEAATQAIRDTLAAKLDAVVQKVKQGAK